MGPYLSAAFSDGDWGGLVPSADGTTVAGAVNLKEIRKVPASSWRSEKLVYVDNVAYTVSEDIACYNDAADVWFAGLADALAFGGEVTIYVDRSNVVRAMEVR